MSCTMSQSNCEWKEVNLDDIAEIISGFAFKSQHFSDNIGYAKAIKITNINPPFIDVDNAMYVDLNSYDKKKLERYRLAKNDFVVAMTGATIGKIGRMRSDQIAYINQRVAKILSKPNIDPSFVYYNISGSDFQGFIINNIDSNSAQENISGSSIGRFPILLPPLEEQKAIASVLSSLDDKIDLLHRQNKTLEAMAETLFRQWFLPAEASAQVGVEEADDTKKVLITEFVEFNPLRKVQKGTFAPYLEMSNVNTSVFHPSAWYNREFSSGMKFINGDTLLARITPCLENGKSTFVTFLENDEIGWGSTEFIVMRSKKNLHPFFTYTLAKNTDFLDYAEGCLEGSSGRQRVNLDHLKNFEVNCPSPEIIKCFNLIAASIVPKLYTNFMQIRALEKLRDTLLPKLMSGEVRVLNHD